jgi:hypothetical protein
VCGGVAVTVAVSVSTSGSTADLPHADLLTCGVPSYPADEWSCGPEFNGRQCSNGLSSTSEPVSRRARPRSLIVVFAGYYRRPLLG